MRAILWAVFAALIVGCGGAPEQVAEAKPAKEFPAELQKVFDKHGGYDLWQSMQSMSYEIVKEEGNEKQFVDLQNRRERIEAANFTCGFDGETYWVEADTSYKGNPKFYTNLMFYFYAMPFVLSDDGIQYTKTDPLTFESKTYPGFRISYGDGVGVSPEDEYFIHYDSETHQMAWLGYTVTYFSGKKSEKISWIRYDDWGDHNGLVLPNALTWYKTEEGKLLEPRNTRTFTNIKVSKTGFKDDKFAKTAGAKVVQ